MMSERQERSAKRNRAKIQSLEREELAQASQQVVADNDLLLQSCANEYGWSLQKSATIISEFKKFMRIKKMLKDYDARICSPSYLIDQVWHMALTKPFSEYYKKLCHGPIIGHRPEGNHYLRI